MNKVSKLEVLFNRILAKDHHNSLIYLVQRDFKVLKDKILEITATDINVITSSFFKILISTNNNYALIILFLGVSITSKILTHP